MNPIYEATSFFPEYQSEEERGRLPYLENLSLLVEKCRQDYANQTALIQGQQRLSYEQLAADVAFRRRLLTEKEVPAGAHVGILCVGHLDARCWFLAVPTSGRVAVMLPPLQDAEKLRALVQKYHIQALITDSSFAEMASAVLPCIILAPEHADTPEAAPQLAKEAPAAIFFTGGSTGVPKGALLSHGALMRGALNGTTFRAGNVFGNRTLTFLPLYHIFGAVAGFLACLYTGTEIHVFTDIPSAVLQIPVIRPTMLVLVPGLADILLSTARMRGAAFLEGLKSIVCGGAPVPEKLILGMLALGVRIYPGYGLTEAANFSCANLNAEACPCSIGQLYPPQQMKLVDGELWLKGDNVMLGYYNDPAETAHVMEEGWLKTGDLATMDEKGYITIIGRKKNMILLPNGENVYPEMLEALLIASPLVKDCLVKEVISGGKSTLGVEIYPDYSKLSTQDFAATEKQIQQVVDEVNRTLPSWQQLLSVKVRKEDFKRMPSLKIDRAHS